MEYIPIAFTKEEVEALVKQVERHPTDYTPLGVGKLKLLQGLELYRHRASTRSTDASS